MFTVDVKQHCNNNKIGAKIALNARLLCQHGKFYRFDIVDDRDWPALKNVSWVSSKKDLKIIYYLVGN